MTKQSRPSWGFLPRSLLASLLVCSSLRACLAQCTQGTNVTYTFVCSTDCNQVSWYLQDVSGDKIVASTPYLDSSSVTDYHCLSVGSYTVYLQDSAGNGWTEGTTLQFQGTGVTNTSPLTLTGKRDSAQVPLSISDLSITSGVPSPQVAPSGPSPPQPACGLCASGLSPRPGTVTCDCVYPMIVTLQLNTDFAQFGSLRLDKFRSQLASALGLDIIQVFLDTKQPGAGTTTLTLELRPLVGPSLNSTSVSMIINILYGQNGRTKVPFSDDLGGDTYQVVAVQPPPGTGTQLSTKASGGLSMAALVGIVAAIAAAFGLAIAALYIARSRQQATAVSGFRMNRGLFSPGSQQESESGVWKPPVATKPETVFRAKRTAEVFTYSELAEATEGFNKGNMVGEGGFGRVYKGILPSGIVAAVKQLDPDGRQGDREFRVEVDLLSRLHHPHLVELLGYCADNEHRLLTYEFMPGGSLQDHLHGRGTILDWPTRMRIAVGSAKGLHYLHNVAEPRVIHRDFKTSNILLTHDFVAKVSDFGLAKLAPDVQKDRHVSTRVLGTFGYVAPEYVMTGHLTAKSDVYSFGVVLLELITGRKPVDMSAAQGQQSLVSWAAPYLSNRERLVRMVDPTLQGMFPLKSLYHIAAVAAMCVQPEADYRPLMADIVESLIPLLQQPVTPSEVVLNIADAKMGAPPPANTALAVASARAPPTAAPADGMCLVCRAAPAEMMVQPCWHTVACSACSTRMTASVQPCPLCRQPISGCRRAPRGTRADNSSSGSGYIVDASHLEM